MKSIPGRQRVCAKLSSRKEDEVKKGLKVRGDMAQYVTGEARWG